VISVYLHMWHPMWYPYTYICDIPCDIRIPTYVTSHVISVYLQMWHPMWYPYTYICDIPCDIRIPTYVTSHVISVYLSTRSIPSVYCNCKWIESTWDITYRVLSPYDIFDFFFLPFFFFFFFPSVYCESEVDKSPNKEEYIKQFICTKRCFENSTVKCFVPQRDRFLRTSSIAESPDLVF